MNCSRWGWHTLVTTKKICAAPSAKWLFGLFFCLIFSHTEAQKVHLSRKVKGEEFNIVRESLLLPHARKLHTIKAAFIIQKFKFPEPWLEGDYHVPFINVQATMGLKRNFSAELKVGTVVVSNQLSAGFRWHRRIGSNFFSTPVMT